MALQKYDFLVLFAVNPSTSRLPGDLLRVVGPRITLARHSSPSSCSSDIATAQRLEAAEPQHARATATVQRRRELVDDKTAITNRLSAPLKEYFPQVLEWFQDKDTLVLCDFLSRWPTLNGAQRARKAPLSAFFHGHDVRYPKVIEQRVQGSSRPPNHRTQRGDRAQPAARRSVRRANSCGASLH